MPRKWTGKWFQNKSGVAATRHGKGRGRSRGLRTQAPVPTLPVVQVTFPKAQQAAPVQPTRRRRPRKPRGDQK